MLKKVKSVICGDSSEQKLPFTTLNKILIVVSSCTFIADMFTDVYVAVIFGLNGDVKYCVLTVLCILIPSIIASIYSFISYCEENKHKKASNTEWLIRYIFIVLQLSPLLRYIESYKYGKVSNKHTGERPQIQHEYVRQMQQRMVDASKLRLFETFLEAGSQMILQLYIITKNFESTQWFQFLSVAVSFVSMAWSFVSYMRNVRVLSVDFNKKKIRKRMIPLLIVWITPLLVARLEALSLFASVKGEYILLFLLLHWTIMFIWILTLETSFCPSRWKEILYNAILAYINIFIFFNVVDTPTRFRMAFYYSLCFIENTFLVTFWCNLTSYDMSYGWIVVGVHYGAFLFGIIVMVIYYRWFHPSGAIPSWRSHPQLPALKVLLKHNSSEVVKDPNESNCPANSVIASNEENVPKQQMDQSEKNDAATANTKEIMIETNL